MLECQGSANSEVVEHPRTLIATVPNHARNYEQYYQMLEHIITASTRPGAVVLDCFAGSGSTLVAAKKLGREFIGIEIDPHWVSVANQRIGQLTLFE